jgi:hypothetical protein
MIGEVEHLRSCFLLMSVLGTNDLQRLSMGGLRQKEKIRAPTFVYLRLITFPFAHTFTFMSAVCQAQNANPVSSATPLTVRISW